MLTVDFELTEKDYISFATFTQLDSPQAKERRRKTLGRRVITFFVIVAILAWIDSGTNDYSSTITFACIFGILFFASPFLQRTVGAKRLGAMYNSPENDYLLQRKEYIFSDTGINISSQFTTISLKWPAIVKKIETPEYFYLYQSSIHAIIIPKKYFNDWQLTDLEKLLSTHLSFRADVGHEIAE